jgi:hypothetical protein
MTHPFSIRFLLDVWVSANLLSCLPWKAKSASEIMLFLCCSLALWWWLDQNRQQIISIVNLWWVVSQETRATQCMANVPKCMLSMGICHTWARSGNVDLPIANTYIHSHKLCSCSNNGSIIGHWMEPSSCHTHNKPHYEMVHGPCAHLGCMTRKIKCCRHCDVYNLTALTTIFSCQSTKKYLYLVSLKWVAKM